jgi:hypothetical protein
MKKINSIAVLLIIGLAVPISTQAIVPIAAVANYSKSIIGSYSDRDWTIVIDYENSTYLYVGENHQTRNRIRLYGAKVSGDRYRKIFDWNNGGTHYQVTWQPQDPDYIRVRVISPNGNEILNRLLSQDR